MEYLAGFIIFFCGWLLLRFLLAATYASGFAEGAWQVTNGGIGHIRELARPVDADDFEAEFQAEAAALDRDLTRRNFDLAKDRANGFGRELVARAWKLRGLLKS